jgi:hypothetical protein
LKIAFAASPHGPGTPWLSTSLNPPACRPSFMLAYFIVHSFPEFE